MGNRNSGLKISQKTGERYISLDSLVLIENRNFYLSKGAEIIGFSCTEDEINNANENGFIKRSRGVDLYLTRNINFPY